MAQNNSKTVFPVEFKNKVSFFQFSFRSISISVILIIIVCFKIYSKGTDTSAVTALVLCLVMLVLVFAGYTLYYNRTVKKRSYIFHSNKIEVIKGSKTEEYSFSVYTGSEVTKEKSGIETTTLYFGDGKKLYLWSSNPDYITMKNVLKEIAAINKIEIK